MPPLPKHGDAGPESTTWCIYCTAWVRHDDSNDYCVVVHSDPLWKG